VRAVAVNVGANTNSPGFRGPVFPDGSGEFVPIPETEPADAPTYGDLTPRIRTEIPADLRDTPVHLDPEFAEYPCCERYTYGDPHGVKARPLLELSAGDLALFYATLDARGEGHPDWVCEEWGAYVVGAFRLATDPVPGEAFDDLPAAERQAFGTNAHVRRERMDAAVLLRGGPGASGLLDPVLPLSGERGTDPGAPVEYSEDSGKGPWWRRPLRFDRAATERLRERIEHRLPGSLDL
jgi:hypothetical protein